MALLGYWLMTEATGTTRADSGGGGYDLDDIGTVDVLYSATSEMSDGSAHNDDPDQNCVLAIADASLPSTFPGKDSGTGTDYTIYIRCQPLGGNSAGIQMALKGTNGTSDYGWTFQNSHSRDRVYLIHHDGTDAHVTGFLGVNNNGWHTFIGTWAGSGDDALAHWGDGVEAGSGHTPALLRTSDKNFHVFTENTSKNDSFEGYIDEIAIWDEVLSDADIATLDSDGIVSFLTPVVDAGVATSAAAALSLTITGGPVSTAANLLSTATAALSTTVVPGTVSPDANLLSAASAALSCTVTGGPVSVAEDLLTAASAALSATITGGAVSTDAGLLTAASAALSVTVTGGAVSTPADLLSATSAALSTTVTGGAVSTAADLLSASSAALTATVQVGTATVDVSILAAASAALGMSVVASGVIVSFDLLPAASAALSPTITGGPVSVSSDLLSAASSALKAAASTTGGTGATLGTARTSVLVEEHDAPRRVHTGRRIVNGKRTGGGRRVSGGRIVGPRAGRGRR